VEPWIKEHFVPVEGGGVTILPDQPSPVKLIEALNAKCIKIASDNMRLVSIVRHYDFSSHTLYGFYVYACEPTLVS